MQDSRYHLFKFKLKPRKLGFFYLITLFFSSCLIHLFRFYNSVTLVPALFTSFFIFLTLLFLLYCFFLITFCLFFLLFYFLSFSRSVSIYLLSCVSLYSLFLFLYFPHCFFPLLYFLRAFFLFFLVIFILYLCFINFILRSVSHSFLVSFVISAPLFRPYFQYSV